MIYSPAVLLIVVIAISALHMVAPDHWVPVTITSFRKKFTRQRTYLLATSIGLAHGVSSAILSIAIAEIGLLFLPAVDVRLFSSLLLIAVALYVIANALREVDKPGKFESISLFVSVIPDPALVPFVLVAAESGLVFMSVLTGAFIAAACLALLTVVVLSSRGLEKALSNIKPVFVDFAVAAALLGMAAFVYFFG